jgi:hypothetical protein
MLEEAPRQSHHISKQLNLAVGISRWYYTLVHGVLLWLTRVFRYLWVVKFTP